MGVFFLLAAGLLAHLRAAGQAFPHQLPCVSRATPRAGSAATSCAGIVGIADHPNPRLEALDRKRAGLGQPMLDLEARSAAGDKRRLDRDLVAEPRRQAKTRPRLDQRMAGEMA